MKSGDVFVFHRKSRRAYIYDAEYELCKKLIEDVAVLPAYSSIRCNWRPVLQLPRWSWGIRDTEFTTYWVK
jgi:hypothetical protein